MSKLFFNKLEQDELLPLPKVLSLSHVSGHKEWSYSSHIHDNCCEIMFIEDGAGIYRIDEQDYAVAAGDLIVVNQGLVHAERSDNKFPLSVWTCSACNILLRGLPQNWIIPAGKNPVLKTVGIETEIKRCFHMLEREYLARQAYAGVMAQLELTKLITLIQRLITTHKLCTIQCHGKSLSHTIKEYIDTHFKEKITLQSLSELFHVSPYHLSHEMKRDLGIAPIHYLISRRIGEAQRLLLSTEWSVTNIAYEVGYQHISYFINLFTCRIGSTPQQFRAIYQTNADILYDLNGNLK